MNPWFGRAMVLAGIVAMVVIRAPHGQRSINTPITESRKGPLEIVLLSLMWMATLILPLIAILTPLLRFADYPLHPAAFACGVVALCAGLYLLHRSHVDLGRNWSITLQIRQNHELVTTGIYRRIRHPMYTAIFLQGVAQALLLPNWLAGPSWLVAFTLMFALRLGAEERMMEDRFGEAYREYRTRSKRLIPGVW